MNFKSTYHKTIDDLVQAKRDAYRGVSDRRERLKIIRAFTNMLNTLSDEEAEELGRTEITNHGMTHRAMLQNETTYASMVTVTNALVEVVVDTDNPERDIVTGMRISEAINRGAIHHNGKFANFWKKVAGELVIAGGCPVVMPSRYGWLPELKMDMFFPSETPLDSEEITFAFDPVRLKMQDLEHLLNAAGEDGNSKFINTKAVRELQQKLIERISQRTDSSSSLSAEEIAHSVRQSSAYRNTTIAACRYYEVKWRPNGESYVSETLFVDTAETASVQYGRPTKDATQAVVLSYRDEAFKNAEDWLHMVTVDSEIGGVKNVDTLRGVAEMQYPSGVDMEELLNLIIEGEKIRARPKLKITDQANVDELARFNVLTDLYVPAGVEEMPFKTSAAGLEAPLQILSANAAGLATSSVANSGQGGELRQQALERQQNSAMLQTNRSSEVYNHLDAILNKVVHRLLTADVKPGCPGYKEIMWIRSYLDKYEIPYKELAKQRYGRFEYIRVRARRTIGNGDRVQQLETSDWLMANIQAYEPVSRPQVIHQATMLRTQDPDLADMLVKPPKAIINAQKVTAENEYDTIKRRAALGQVLPVAQDDIHQDHIPVHLLDMQAHVAAHAVRPWDKLDVLSFAGLVEHVGEHLKVLLSSEITAAEGKMFVQDYQNITQAAQVIVQEVEERTSNDQMQLTPKEQADLQIKWAQLELEGRKLGIKTADMQKLWESRESRAALGRRQQFVREINEDRRLRLDRERVEQQAELAKMKSSTDTDAKA